MGKETIIIGSLNDAELKNSINTLVAHVAEQTKKMADNFDEQIQRMKTSLKSLGNTTVDFGIGKSGGVVDMTKLSKAVSEATSAIQQQANTGTSSSKQQAQANKELVMTYDQMQSALQKIAKDNNGMKAVFSRQELQSYIDLLRKLQTEYIKVNTQEGGGFKSDQIKRNIAELEKIITNYQTILKNIDLVNSRQGTIDIKKWIQDLTAVDDRYNKLVRWYQILEKEDQRQIAEQQKKHKQRLDQIEKERQAQQKAIDQYQNSILKTEFTRVMKMPTSSVDEMEAKLRRLSGILAGMRETGLLSPTQVVNAENEIKRLTTGIQSARDAAKQASQSLEQVYQPKSAKDSFYSMLDAMTQKVAMLRQEIANINNTSISNAINAWNDYQRRIEEVKEKIQTLRDRLNNTTNPVAKGGVQSLLDAEKQALQRLRDEQAAYVNEMLRQDRARAQEKRNAYEQEKQLIKELIGVEQQSASVNQQRANQEQRVTEWIRRQAQAIRESEEWRTRGIGYYHFNTTEDGVKKSNMRVIDAKSTLSVEEQILQVHREIAAQQEREAAQLRAIASEENSTQQTAQQRLSVEREITQEYDKRKKYSAPTVVDNGFQRMIANTLKIDVSSVLKGGDSVRSLTAYVNQLKSAWDRLTTNERKTPFGKQLRDEIQATEREISKLRSQLNRPINLDTIIGTSAKTIDDIIYKIQQLNNYKRGLNITDPKQKDELNQVDNAINKLNGDLNKYMSTTQKAQNANSALTRSWNYMKNRLAFYFTVGASTAFIKNLIQVRSEYEMNERALGILIDSAERGTQIFNELSQMALVSPYTLIELSAAAKQLTAYDVAARDVVDTTRRLADMASAVGIPIERLTYALGQIKAYGHLNSRDARMFANAGIPLVKQLSEYYTELEGRMISTADIYDRIKKKTIGYADVMSVITKMTDEGGKFFDFQAKMADTLKVRLANLTLAWNNMLNEIGQDQQGILTSGIGALRTFFLHWRDLNTMLRNVAMTFGFFKGLQFIQLLMNGQLATKMGWVALMGTKMTNMFISLWQSLWKLVSTPLTWFALLGTALVSGIMAAYDADKAIRKFNNSIREGAEDNYKNIKDFISQSKELRDSLYTFKDVDLGGGEVRREITGTQDINNDEAKKVWETVREQIELTSKSSDTYIGQLLQIENVSERLRQGFQILDNISEVNAALKEIDDKTIDINQDWSQWWNLWAGFDGLIGNLKDLEGELNTVNKEFGGLDKIKESADAGNRTAKAFLKDYEIALERFREDLKETTDSIVEFITMKGWSGDTNKINEVFSNVTNKLINENQLNPQEAYLLQLEAETARANATKKALQIRIKDENEALKAARDENAKADVQARLDTLNRELELFNQNNGRGKVIWENFTKWMSEQHISELREKFRGMDAEEIAHLDFTKGEWYDWAQKTAAKYAKEHKLSYDDAFRYLNNWVKQADKWSIFIPLVISTEGGKSAFELLNEYDGLVDDADSKIERLKRRQEELNRITDKTTDNTKELAKVNEELANAEKQKADAEAKGGHGKKEDKDAKQAAKDAEKARKKAEQDRKKQEREAARAQRQAESELQKALKNELSLIDKIRSAYQALTKEGASHSSAIRGATSGFGETVKSINAVLSKWGIAAFDPKRFAGISNPRELVNLLQAQLNRILATGRAKPEEIKDFQVKIRDLKVDAQKYDLKKITEGLNNELGRLKEEYELAVELDANPELGEMFTHMLGIDMESMPRTFGEMFDKANDIAKEKLRELGVSVSDFDLMNTIIKPDSQGMWMGLSFEGDAVKELLKWQDSFRDAFKKNMSDTENMLDDYVKKYGNYADKIAEIEAGRLEKLKKLNEAYYNEEMRRLPEYTAKLAAIEQGAIREKGNVKLDEFKNSQLYISMFENLQYTSTATLEMMRDKLRELKKELGSLSPEQLKQVTKQFESIDNELIRRNPFKGLIKNVKDYAKAVGKTGKKAQEDFKKAQKKYDFEVETLAALKEQLAQKRALDPLDTWSIKNLENEVNIQDDKVRKLKEELALAEELNEQYNLMRQLMGSQWIAISTVINVIAANLQSLSELRDTLKETFNIELGDSLDAVVDGLTKVGNGLSQITSSAQSGNVVGVVNGVINTVGGIGDSIASIFGDGSARTKRLNREINESEESVRRLSLAYKYLERMVNKSLGAAETQARRLSIENKKAQLAETERQLELERRKRSKDRDDDAIKEYQERIQDLRFEIEDLGEELVSNLTGSDIKSAAEEFVDAWVDAWRAGETTLDAINEKMDEMIMNLIKKAASSAIVEKIIRPLYDAIDKYTSEESEGGVNLTTGEIQALAMLSKNLGVETNDALGAFYRSLEALGAVTKNVDGSSELSALQQGIQGITEDTAGALEAYMNGVSQQVYLQSDLLTQIRDTIAMYDLDIQVATIGQILLQLQASYQVQMSINNILSGVLNPSGMAFNVELTN